MTTRGPYAKSAAVRARIIDACTMAFAVTGFQGTTTSEIARQAGISYTGLVHHFPSKQSLLLAVLSALDEQAEHILSSAVATDPITDPAGVLDAMTDIWLKHEAQPGLVELHATLSAEAAAPDHPAHEHYARRSTDVHAFYTRLYEAFAIRGELKAPLAPSVIADVTVGALDGALSQWLYHRDSSRLETTVRAFFSTVVTRP